MRILIISNLYPPLYIGGYELACSNVAKALFERGHEIFVLTTWSHIPIREEDPVWVHRSLDLHWYVPHTTDGLVRDRDLHNATCSSYVNTLRLLEAIREFRPDIVSVWNPTGIGGLALMDLLNQIDVPWTLHLGDRAPVDIEDNVPSYIQGLFCANANALYDRARILAVSQHLLDEIKSVSGISFAQYDIVAGWADTQVAKPHKAYLRDGKTRFVAAGGIFPHKGIDLILQASERLKAEGLDFCVDIFGNGEIPRYLEMASVMRVHDHVRFLGPLQQSDLIKEYAGYDAFLCPTWERDPFPFAPLEAAACGTPPILTRNCGTSERLVDGVHCLKIDRTVDSLTEVMRSVAQGHVDLERIGRAGMRLMKSDLSFDSYLQRTEAVLSAHARPWRHEAADDPRLPLLAFIKHNLSVRLRFGW